MNDKHCDLIKHLFREGRTGRVPASVCPFAAEGMVQNRMIISVSMRLSVNPVDFAQIHLYNDTSCYPQVVASKRYNKECPSSSTG